ncbi:murein biosynthesis integral membrane protein MurJ, partial [bacterium]|nr:murein biosynthesis integral membrane protein MurJ [bacterium]
PIFSLAWAVLIGGIAQWTFQWPALKRLRLWPRFAWDWRDPGVRHILRLMGPAILGASVVQINLFVDAIFASFLPIGSLSWLYYSERLIEFPLGMFGVALATVILPHLSEKHLEQSPVGFFHSMDWALRWTVFGALPAAIGLYVLAGPILTALFQYGAFTPHDVSMTARSLVAMSLGLVAFIAIKILVSAFYARHDTRFPVKVAIISLVMNAVLNFILMGPFAHVGLALASTIAAWVNVLLLAWKLQREGVYWYDPAWNRFLLRVIGAALVMMAGLWALTPELAQWQTWGAGRRLLVLVGLVIGGSGLYGGTAWVLGLRKGDLQLQSHIAASHGLRIE